MVSSYVGMFVCECLIDLKHGLILCRNVCVRMFDRPKTVSSYVGMFVCECSIDLKQSHPMSECLCANVR